MQKHNNYNNKEEPLMPTKKPKEEKEKIAPEKAVVSPIGEYEENPVPEKSGDYVTKNGNKIHYS